jgi:DNA-binding NarL/FixJ family response regulator
VVQARLVSALGDSAPDEPDEPTRPLSGSLTPREVEVLTLIGEGLSTGRSVNGSFSARRRSKRT